MDELSGKPMKGTSVLNSRPKCNGGEPEEEEQSRTNGAANLNCEWKKCPQPRKKDFQVTAQERSKKGSVGASGIYRGLQKIQFGASGLRT